MKIAKHKMKTRGEWKCKVGWHDWVSFNTTYMMEDGTQRGKTMEIVYLRCGKRRE